MANVTIRGFATSEFSTIWRRPHRNRLPVHLAPSSSAVGKRALQGARGQARLPSAWIQRKLLAQADAEGWGSHDADIEDELLDQTIKADSELADA
jgi:hypothetical protein